ncbi:MAG: LD-carboxypeptidase [Atopobiaceae bacterium]|nr:LD-carboxypeptidase [Atopobiaceae bacterium]
MNKKLVGMACAALLLGLQPLTACSQQQPAPAQSQPAQTEEQAETTFTEGADSTCKATGYTNMTASHPDYFLKEGDKVAVISPSALPTREQADATIAGLKDWGYVPVEGKHVCDEGRTLEDCRSDLMWALEDPDIAAIFCVRGGYAASEVMDTISLDAIRNAQKPIIGYSDITVYHAAWTAAGLPSIHSSMSVSFGDLPQDCVEVEKQLLKGEVPAYECAVGELSKDGDAEGILIGGNLSTLTVTLDTAYDCTRLDQPYILFLEEVGEDMRHIHRFITILDHQGALDNAAGIVFGEWADVPIELSDYDGMSRGGKFTSVADMINREFLSDTDVPVAFGFPAGHAEANYPLLMGEKAHMKVSNGTLTLTWE